MCRTMLPSACLRNGQVGHDLSKLPTIRRVLGKVARKCRSERDKGLLRSRREIQGPGKHAHFRQLKVKEEKDAVMARIWSTTSSVTSSGGMNG